MSLRILNVADHLEAPRVVTKFMNSKLVNLRPWISLLLRRPTEGNSKLDRKRGIREVVPGRHRGKAPSTSLGQLKPRLQFLDRVRVETKDRLTSRLPSEPGARSCVSACAPPGPRRMHPFYLYLSTPMGPQNEAD